MLFSYAQILGWLQSYKYVVLFPLAALEGPIVSFAVGVLVSLGYVEFFPAYVILVLGDLVPDSMYYYLGRFGNRKKLLDRYGSRFSLISRNFMFVEKLWQHHGRKTMFLSKLAYGLSIPFLISAGMVQMPYGTFIAYALPVTLFQYGVLMAMGYYFGHSYALTERYVQDVGMFIATTLLLFVVGYILVSKYAWNKIKEIEREAESSTELPHA